MKITFYFSVYTQPFVTVLIIKNFQFLVTCIILMESYLGLD